jgi:hypothetical protein
MCAHCPTFALSLELPDNSGALILCWVSGSKDAFSVGKYSCWLGCDQTGLSSRGEWALISRQLTSYGEMGASKLCLGQMGRRVERPFCDFYLFFSSDIAPMVLGDQSSIHFH